MSRIYSRSPRQANKTAQESRTVKYRVAEQQHVGKDPTPAIAIFANDQVVLVLDEEAAQRLAREISDSLIRSKLPTDWKKK